MFAYNWTEGLFSPISPSSQEIKLQANVRAEELTLPTPTDKWAHVIRVYDTPALIKGICIFNPEEMAIERSLQKYARKVKGF